MVGTTDDLDRLAPQLNIRTESPDTGTRIVVLRGELDVATDAEEVRCVCVDLVEVTFIDSTGLMTLLNALRRMVRRDARLVIACSNPTVLRLFEATRTDATFEIVPTREQALG